MWKSYMTRIASLFLFLGMIVSGCGSAENSDVTLYVVRHGKTMLNTTDRVQGWADAVLTPAGEQVVGYTAAGMKDIAFSAAYSSDSGRAMQTANIILAKNTESRVQLKTDWRLREFNFGSYEGDLNHTMWSDIAASKGKTLEEWMADGFTPEAFANAVAELDKVRVTPGENWPAEDYATISNRLREGLQDIIAEARSSGGGNVLIVSHGLSIGALVSMLDPDAQLPAGGVKNASVTKIVYRDGNYHVTNVGDLSYTENGKAQGD